MQDLRVILIIGLMMIVFCANASAQKARSEKPFVCKNGSSVKGRYKTLFVGSSGGELFSIDIVVKVKHQTDENYLAVANQLKAKYCKEGKMYVVMYDNREHSKLGSIPQPDCKIEGYPRALYLIDRSTGREALEIYKIVNGKIETRILSTNSGMQRRLVPRRTIANRSFGDARR